MALAWRRTKSLLRSGWEGSQEDQTLTELEDRLGCILDRHQGTTFTAAVLRLESSRGLLLELAGGLLNPETDQAPVTPSSPFDLASLTKLFTAAAVLRLVAGSQITLDEPLAKHLSRFAGPGKDRVTLRHLLTHSSGLPALVRLFGPEGHSGDPWDALFGCKLINEPGQTVLYSDVGFMLLGRLVAEVTGRPLPEAMRQLVLEPLCLDATGYGPSPTAPATEMDPWRGRRLQGEVHDENAAALEGAAGHAGLFAPAPDVVRFARCFGFGGDFLPRDLAAEARRVHAVTGDERRGLGWKLRSGSADAAESVFSAGTFGHYGFTGTAVWTDPRRDLTAVLLTNRVYFGRDPERVHALRREVFAVLSEALPAGAG